MTETRFVLKILSGLHAGAECYLPPGATRLGKAPDCDLILHDQGLADEHLVFTCSADAVQVECRAPGAMAWLDDGQPTPASALTIRDFGLLSSAGLYLALGVEGRPWPALSLQQLVAQFSRSDEPEPAGAGVDGGAEPAAGDAGAGDATNGLADDDAGPAADGGEENAAVEDGAGEGTDEGAQDAAAAGKRAWQRARRGLPRHWLASGAALALLVALGLGAYWRSHSHGADEPAGTGSAQPAPAMSDADIEAIAARYRLDASFELGADKVLTVNGYAPDEQARHGFARALYERGIIVKSRLVVVEHFKNNIHNILEQFVNPSRHETITVSVQPDDIKTLVLQGYVQDGERWRKAVAETVGEVGAIGYVDEVTHWDDGYNHLQELLRRYGMAASVRLEQDRENDRILLFARRAAPRLQALAQEYRQSYTRPELAPAAPGASAAARQFTANKIVGASFNALNYILLDNGQRYFVGSTTPDGYRIDDINEDFALFSRDGKDHIFYFRNPEPTAPTARRQGAGAPE